MALGRLRQRRSLCLLAVACLAVGSLAVAKAVSLLASCVLDAVCRDLQQMTKHKQKKVSPLARGLRTPLIDGCLQMYGVPDLRWLATQLGRAAGPLKSSWELLDPRDPKANTRYTPGQGVP